MSYLFDRRVRLSSVAGLALALSLVVPAPTFASALRPGPVPVAGAVGLVEAPAASGAVSSAKKKKLKAPLGYIAQWTKVAAATRVRWLGEITPGQQIVSDPASKGARCLG